MRNNGKETKTMLSEERIKEQFQLALMDQNEEKSIENTRVFYRSDYIGKEMIKSFFAGTICFLMIIALYFLRDAEKLILTINTMDYVTLLKQVLFLYIGFMILYFIATFLVYFFRYLGQRKKQKKYRVHLKKLQDIYEKDAN